MSSAEPRQRVLVADRLSAEGLLRLSGAGLEVRELAPGASPQALREAVAEVHALVVRSQTQVTGALVEGARELLIVGRAGVGYENIDVEACSRHGVAVVNAPGASAITTAERTVAMMLAMLHQVAAADRSVREGRWDRRSFLVNEAFDKRLGVLGFGNVGRVVADRAAGLGMQVLVHDPNVAPEVPFNLGHRPVGFDELFEQADIVTCHVSADARLTGLVGARELGRMRRGSWLVNTSRGFVVDEPALVEALASGQLAGAALDVFAAEPLPRDSPVQRLPNVVLSPHLGASSVEGERRVAVALATDVVRFLREGTAANLLARPARLRHPRARAGAA